MSNKVKSGIGTAIIMALVAVVLLAFGYDPPDPPIPEEGVEVNIGDSDFGMGSDPEPASEASNYAPPAAQNQVATQQTEPSISMPSTPNQGNVTNPAAQEQPQVENKEPEINQNALFTGRRNRTNQGGSGSEGNTTGNGNQGNPNGTPNSNNYDGNGGNGVKADLKGRSAVVLPRPPSYQGKDQGNVVIKVWVNQQGYVVRAEAGQKGTTLAKEEFVQRALEYAKKAKFTPSLDSPDEQIGYITYMFRI